MLSALHGPWLVIAGFVLLLVAAGRGPRPRSGTLWLLAVLTLTAAGARLVGGLWGPLHVNGQGPLWIRGALDPAALAGYGPGYFEIFSWVTRLGPAPDDPLFAANAVLSALSPALLYAVARLVGVGGGGAVAVALVLAADPVSIRTAASEAYFTPIVFLVLAVQASLALAVQADRRGDAVGADLALGAAALLAAAAARVHPAGYLPLALCPLVVFGAAQDDGWVARGARTVAAAAAVGAAVLLTSASTIAQASSASEMTRQGLANLTEPDWRIVIAAVVVVFGVRLWAVPPWLPLLGACSLLAVLATGSAFRQHPLWALCYQRLFLPGVLLGAAALLPARLQGLLWALGVSVAAIAVLLLPALTQMRGRTTEQIEYRFLKEVLRDVPSTCMVAGVSRAGRRIWEIPGFLVGGSDAQSAGNVRSLEDADDLDLAAASGGCLLYVRGSLCSSAEGRPRCESVERGARLDRVASRSFPAAPSYVGLPYDRTEVEVVVFRVATRAASGGGRGGVSDGAAITPEFAQALYERVTPLRASDGCRVVRLDTSRFRMTIGIKASSGPEHAIELAAAGPLAGGGRTAGAWALSVPAQAERDCGATLAEIEAILSELQAPTTVGTIDRSGRRFDARVMSVAGGVLLVLAVCGQWLARRRRRRLRQSEA